MLHSGTYSKYLEFAGLRDSDRIIVRTTWVAESCLDISDFSSEVKISSEFRGLLGGKSLPCSHIHHKISQHQFKSQF